MRKGFGKIVVAKGWDVDAGHEYIPFDCGHEIVDGVVRRECRNLPIKERAISAAI